MTAENLDSNAIVNLDTQPIVTPSAGEGAPGDARFQTDYTTHTTNFGSATGNSSRTSRFPVEAKVKHVWLYTNGLDSSSSQTLTLDVNVAFSDSAYDVTPVYLQALIPVAAATGATIALASYGSTANKLFGSALTVAASGATQWEEVTFKGTNTTVYTPALAQEPMWAVLGGTGSATAAVNTAGGGFAQQGGSGQICSPGGFFDILVVTAHTATTNATGTIGTEVDFVI
jgi:hypothetical protein